MGHFSVNYNNKEGISGLMVRYFIICYRKSYVLKTLLNLGFYWIFIWVMSILCNVTFILKSDRNSSVLVIIDAKFNNHCLIFSLTDIFFFKNICPSVCVTNQPKISSMKNMKDGSCQLFFPIRWNFCIRKKLLSLSLLQNLN